MDYDESIDFVKRATRLIQGAVYHDGAALRKELEALLAESAEPEVKEPKRPKSGRNRSVQGTGKSADE